MNIYFYKEKHVELFSQLGVGPMEMGFLSRVNVSVQFNAFSFIMLRLHGKLVAIERIYQTAI